MDELHLDVTISQARVGDGEHPVLYPTSWIKAIDRFTLWDTLFGTDDLASGKSMLEDFWGKFSRIYSDFEGLQHGIPWSQMVPLYIHGDEGQHYKKNAVMVLQFQSVLGRGTSRLSAARQGDVFGNEQGYYVNQKGVTFRTRLLFSVMPKEQYAKSAQPLEDLFERLCEDLQSAFRDGVQLMDGSKLHLCPIGVKGDWPFLASRLLARLERTI
ncbi:unnamed protein product [Symbiodinium sp. CCMP2456]|nr:unnamed protein product [Symbiodinium sp. CCMP2456]